MPISQDRVLKLLEAGEAYREYFFNLHKAMRLICVRSNEFDTATQIADEMRLQLDMAVLRHRDADIVLTEERSNYKHTHAVNTAKRERLRKEREADRLAGVLRTKPRNSDYTVPQITPVHDLPGNEPPVTPNYDLELDRARAAKNPDYQRFLQHQEEAEQLKRERARVKSGDITSIFIEEDMGKEHETGGDTRE